MKKPSVDELMMVLLLIFSSMREQLPTPPSQPPRPMPLDQMALASPTMRLFSIVLFFATELSPYSFSSCTLILTWLLRR